MNIYLGSVVCETCGTKHWEKMGREVIILVCKGSKIEVARETSEIIWEAGKIYRPKLGE